jgi:hypothetical protein
MLQIDGTTDYVVLLTEGQHLVPRPIISVVPYNRGLAMRYRNGANQIDNVYVPHGFPFLEAGGKYYVGKRVGNNSACPVLAGSVDRHCPGEDLSALIRADGIGVGFKALYEHVIPWKAIIIIGVIAAVVVGLIAWLGPRLFA